MKSESPGDFVGIRKRALNAEMAHHLAGENGAGSSRNGCSKKTVTTDTGRLDLAVPRDRQASFDPQSIAKDQRRFPGFDEKVISMVARGMSNREIVGHLNELYGIDVSPDLISAVLLEHNVSPKPFIWLADPDAIIAARCRGFKALTSIHQAHCASNRRPASRSSG